ncbi:hypothetical protein BDN70DRAFT_878372 [Pholiota conissans]|uniref:HMG box domain-containing protein n=1 Tax=Pholiota conissans TaxID=109636 RepID=A0A9P5Z289_9AGAR|nr:hypothetical protein BDN70DRAFT_878372 [Pholiota conissans]
MLSAILKAPFARSLFLTSVSRLARPAVARPLLFSEAKRTFLTTTAVFEGAAKPKKTAASKAKKAPAAKKPKKAAAKAPKKVKVKKVKKVKAKEPKVFKKHLKLPFPRPRTAWQDFYFNYIREHRLPHEKLTDHAHGASLAWRSLSAEEKEKYGASKEEREEYLKKSKEFRTTDATYRKAFRVLRKRRATPLHLGGYNAFVRMNFDKTSPLSFIQQGALLANRWSALSPEEKAVWKERGAEMTSRKLSPLPSKDAQAEKSE